jgi:hypothetical protein
VHGGSADAIVLVDVTVAPAAGKATTKRLPLQVGLINTGTEANPVWKLNKLQQISTGSASTGGQ